MSDRVKISQLTELVNVDPADQIVVLDVSDTTESSQGTTKRAAKSELKGLNWQGEWSAGDYLADDAVFHDGSAYVANTDTSEEPGTGSDWDMLARKGEDGADGDNGADGSTILNGTVDPTTEGEDGDFYYRTDTNEIFGPKVAGVWPAGVSLVGPQGEKGLQWQGAWSAGEYQIDDVVEHNGSSWIAIAVTTGEPSDSADWELVAEKGEQGDKGDKGTLWQGAWTAGTYQIDDIVSHQGSSWIAIAVTTEEPSDSATEWNLVARKGTDGEGAEPLTVLTATGSINSSNVSFVFSEQPTTIVSDGVILRVNAGWTWNGGTMTATMALPPNFDLFGLV